jgi:predicted Zn finger-like uncharacterized protein
MSLITRCPACATQFKVAPDQLKLSDGWVRCGHCSDVFDANRYLESRAPGATQSKPSDAQQAAPPLGRKLPAQPSVSNVSSIRREVTAPSSQAVQAELALPLSSKSVSAAFQTDDLDVDLTLEERGSLLDTDQAQPLELDRLSPTSRSDQAITRQVDRDKEGTEDFHTELQRFAAGQGKPPEGGRAVMPAGPASRPTASVPAPTTTPASAEVAQLEVAVAQPLGGPQGAAALEPGFVRQARRRALWRSPGVRALLTLVVLLLSALLAAQWAVQARDRLAARYPDTQPLLASLCAPLGCTIGAVRDLQAVVIDSATLTRRLDNFYAFDLVLKNTSAIALAVPALELSLTNTTDAVISRRVFLPEELPGVPPLLPPQSTVSVSLRLSLPVGSELPMTGYRALVFYP